MPDTPTEPQPQQQPSTAWAIQITADGVVTKAEPATEANEQKENDQ